MTGRYYETPDKDFVVTKDDGTLDPRGGAMFEATASAVTAVAFSGDDTGIRHSGTIDFTGLENTPTGYIAMAYADEVIASADGGATFTLAANAASGRLTIDRLLAHRGGRGWVTRKSSSAATRRRRRAARGRA